MLQQKHDSPKYIALASKQISNKFLQLFTAQPKNWSNTLILYKTSQKYFIKFSPTQILKQHPGDKTSFSISALYTLSQFSLVASN